MSNKKFLEKVAETILSRSQSDLMETVVVFPNKRPEIFLKKYITEQTDTGFWIPDIRSIDEFIAELAPIAAQDPMLTWFELYEIHKKIEGNKARQPDDFITLAPIMLNDFNDADLAMANIKELFTFLSKAKALERWHPDGGELSEMEKSYLDFYSKLLRYYEQLEKSLSNKGMGTKGMVYRNVAENIETSNNIPWKQIIFAGLNALTSAEETIVSELRKKLPVTLLWDADEYYINPQKHSLPKQEAGLYLKKLFKKFNLNKPQWVENNLTEGEKTITMTAAPKQISQVKYTGQLLEQWSHENPSETAIVLADEKLLIPLLASLPSEPFAYNVTMGYPMSLSQLALFINLWIEMLVIREQRKNRAFSIPLILSLLQSQVLQMMIPKANEIATKLSNNNSAFINRNDLKGFITDENDAIFNLLFDIDSKVINVFSNLLKLIEKYKFTIDQQEKQEGQKLFNTKYPMIRQQVAAVFPVLKKVQNILSKNEEHINIKVFQQLFSRLIGSAEISLKGEPLNGVQIMGMLETRLLDFKRVVVLSANEGHLPKSSIAESFIPFDIRREYNLPLPEQKNAIFAYYFFRLLQRADEVQLVYNSEVGDLGGGEKSRYLFQLEIEAAKANPKLKISEEFVKIQADYRPEEVQITINKDDSILQQLESIGKKGFSPSALNQYIECSLKFYFARILKLTPPDELRTSIEADIFGSIVHEVLEKIYKPDTHKIIDTERLSKKLKNLDAILEESLKKNRSTGDVKHGKNLLIVEVMRKYIHRFVKKDIEDLKQNPRVLVGVEEALNSVISVSNNRNILIKGFIDRIDKLGQEVRISDYKTGAVIKKDLKFKDWELLLTDKKHAKAFQTITYGWLYDKNHPEAENITVGVFSLRNISEGFITPKFPDGTEDNWLNNFEGTLITLLEQIFDPEEPFAQAENAKACEYCDFKGICNRK